MEFCDFSGPVCPNCGTDVRLINPRATEAAHGAYAQWRVECKAYLSERAPPLVRENFVAAGGDGLPGTEMKKLIRRWLRIEPDEDCPCNAHAAEMDARGCRWCRANIDTIVGWLRAEADRRGLPFVDYFGRKLVELAINREKNAIA